MRVFLLVVNRAEDTADKQNETALYIYEMLGKEVVKVYLYCTIVVF